MNVKYIKCKCLYQTPINLHRAMKRNVKIRALDLSNQSISAFLCKPAIVQYKDAAKLEPGICKYVYVQCNSQELCRIAEIEFLQAPAITFLESEKNEIKTKTDENS